MAKFYGVIGYAEESVESPSNSGIWVDNIVEKKYYGDVIRNSRSINEGEFTTNFDLSVNNSISIVADAYANEHFFAIRYVRWAGTLWIVSEVTVQSPRLILQLGGVYNGPAITTTEPSEGDSGE